MPEHDAIPRSESHLTKLHAAEHTDGTDDIQNATGSVKGLATAAQITKLNAIESGATADQTRAEIVGLWTGTPDGTKYLRDDGTLATPAGGGGGGDADTLEGHAAAYFATDADFDAHVGAGGGAHANAVAAGAAGFMTGTDKTKLNGIESGATADQTASEILTALLTVDGSGSGLDADTLDGHDTSYFQTASGYTASDVLSKLLTVDGSGSGLDADLLDGHDTSYFAQASHNHAATDINSGTMATARLGSGTADGTTFLRGDQTWAVPSGGSGRTPTHTVSSDVANATTSFADITDLTHSVVSGTTYRFYALICYATSLSTVGASFAYNGPTTTFQSFKAVWGGTSNTVQTQTDAQAYDVNNVSTAHGAQGFYTATIEGIVKPNASGTLAMRFKSDGDGTITVKAGSTLEIW